MISIVACCHGAKLCPHAARDFQSQHKQCQVEIYVDKTIGQHTEVRTPRRLKETEQLNDENLRQQM